MNWVLDRISYIWGLILLSSCHFNTFSSLHNSEKYHLDTWANMNDGMNASSLFWKSLLGHLSFFSMKNRKANLNYSAWSEHQSGVRPNRRKSERPANGKGVLSLPLLRFAPCLGFRPEPLAPPPRLAVSTSIRRDLNSLNKIAGVGMEKEREREREGDTPLELQMRSLRAPTQKRRVRRGSRRGGSALWQ